MNQNTLTDTTAETADPNTHQPDTVQRLAVAYIPSGDTPSVQAARRHCQEQADELGLSIAYEFDIGDGELEGSMLAVLNLYRFNPSAPKDDFPMPVDPFIETVAYGQRRSLLSMLAKPVALAASVADDEARGIIKGTHFFSQRKAEGLAEPKA